MKKIITIALCAVFACTLMNADAKIRRVGFFGNQINNQDYTSLQSANDEAKAGDTLLIFPGSWSASLNKKLVIIGYGYFLTGTGADSGLQVTTGYLSVSINFNTNSDNTILEGLDNLLIYINGLVNNVLITRCRISQFAWYSIQGQLKNWHLTQSYISQIVGDNYNTTPVFVNLLFDNCILGGSSYLQFSSGLSTGAFNNNIFINNPDFKNGSYSLYNNVFLSLSVPANYSNCIFDYNICYNTIPNNAPYNHNKTTVDLTTVFVGYPTQGTYSYDSRFTLAAGSPAKNAGTLGNGIKTDCGVFGGANPYHLAGIPPIPSFYKLTAPSNIAGSNPYNITFSVRGNN
jgi:hypothetical protein